MKNISLITVSFAILVFVQAELTKEQKEKINTYSKSCEGVSGIDEATIEKARKGDFALQDKKLGAYALCMGQKTGVLNNNAELQKDVIIAKAPAEISKENIEKLVEKCKSEKGASHEETAIKLFKCYYDNTPTHLTLV